MRPPARARQYDAVDPDNRLVAGELDHRWNERLLALRTLENERDALVAHAAPALTEAERERLLALGADGTDADVVELVAVLARQLPDKAIAAILNRAGKATGRGNGWTRSRVCWLRNHRGIAPYREGERTERGEVTLEEASETLKVSEATVRRLIADKVLTAAQYCKGAPWVIRADDLQDENVKQAANARRQRRPASADQRQNVSAI
jgi:excisionase family DNA binding protein